MRGCGSQNHGCRDVGVLLTLGGAGTAAAAAAPYPEVPPVRQLHLKSTFKTCMFVLFQSYSYRTLLPLEALPRRLRKDNRRCHTACREDAGAAFLTFLGQGLG